MAETVDNPLFARFWSAMAAREPESVRALRRENLRGLTGRVLEVGAGAGTNFALYPDTVAEVVAVEPEPRLFEQARAAAETAPVRVTVQHSTIDALAGAPAFDAVVSSMVLCSVGDPRDLVSQMFSLLRPGGEIRYVEHIAGTGARGRLQRFADVSFWPRLFGNCHTHRDTEATIAAAGFVPQAARREWVVPKWVPVPTAEVAIGRAVRPA